MGKFFRGIKVLIWDFDGTLYKRNDSLWREIRESEYHVIMNHTGWTRERTIAEFTPLYARLHSGTTTAAKLSGIATYEAAKEGESYIQRSKYIRGNDVRLVQLFARLQSYTHFMLVNGVKTKTEVGLSHLGINPGIFKEIVTSEIVAENKPSEAGFRYIMGKTGLPPSAHMMIGDREDVDLAPAKKLGIKTCLVWADKASQVADTTLPSVYDVVQILL